MKEVRELSYLEKRFKVYQRNTKKIKELKAGKAPKTLSTGDVICLYGDNSPIYAVVVEDGEIKNCVVLASELVLAGEGPLVRVNHLVSLLRVTPLNFYLTCDMEKYCEVIGKTDAKKIVESHQKRKTRSFELGKRGDCLWESFRGEKDTVARRRQKKSFASSVSTQNASHFRERPSSKKAMSSFSKRDIRSGSWRSRGAHAVLKRCIVSLSARICSLLEQTEKIGLFAWS